MLTNTVCTLPNRLHWLMPPAAVQPQEERQPEEQEHSHLVEAEVVHRVAGAAEHFQEAEAHNPMHKCVSEQTNE